MVPEFANEPLTDFSNPVQRQAMDVALRQVKGEFSRERPLVIGGQRVTTQARIDSLNPCQKTHVVGRTAKTGQPEADRAREAAWAAFTAWSRWQRGERA